MSTATLVLYKAARTTAHLNENLRLLAANEGETLTTSYAIRWFASDAQTRPPEPGEVGLVAFAPYPYERFIPCRLVTIRGITAESAYHQLALEAGPFVTVAAQAKLADVLATTSADRHPRQAFVSRIEDLDVAVADDGSGADTAWQSITETLAQHGEYTDALFGRLASEPDTMTVSDPCSLMIRIVGMRTPPTARLEAVDGDVTLSGWTAPDTGPAIAELLPRAPGRVHATLRLLAHGQLSAPITIRGTVESVGGEIITDHDGAPQPIEVASMVEPPAAPAAAAVAQIPGDRIGLRRVDVRRLLLDLDRRHVDDPGLQIAELAAEADPDDSEVASAAASFLARADRHDEATSMLARFDPGDLPVHAVYLRFLSACKAGHLEDANRLMRRLDFATDDQFGLLTAALDTLPDATAVELGFHLITQVLDVHRSLDLFERLRSRITQPNDVGRYAEHLWTNVSVDEGIGLLIEHTTEAAPDSRLLQRLLEYVGATDGNQDIGPQLIAETGYRIERNELDRLAEIVELSRTDARYDHRLQIVRLVCAEWGSKPAHRVAAVSMLCQESDSARAAGRVQVAAELAEQAAAIAVGDEAATLVAADSVEQARAALTATEPLRSLLARDRDARIETLRARIGGVTLRIVGGKRDPSVADELRTTLGFKKVEWTESERHHRTNTDWVDTVDPVQTVVVMLTDAVSHATSGPLKERCQTRKIRYVEATRGIDAIVGGLLTLG